MDYTVSHIRWMSALNIVLGLWVTLSPWLLGYSSPIATTSSVILGTAVIIFGLIREIAPETAWPSWVNFAAGVWLVFAPFILQLNLGATFWNLLITGIMISLVSYANTKVQTIHAAM